MSAAVPPALHRCAAHLGFALYLASNDSQRDNILSSGLPVGFPEKALYCADNFYLNVLAPAIRVLAGLVDLVAPPASSKSSFG